MPSLPPSRQSLTGTGQRWLSQQIICKIKLLYLNIIIVIQTMGQNDSKVTVKEGDLQKFGKVQYLVPDKPNQMVRMRVNLQINKDEEDFKEWRQKMQGLKKRCEITDLMVLPLSFESSNCLVCTNTKKKNLLSIYYEKINFSLSQVIKNRKYFKKYFTQSEIWYLLYVLVKVAAYFEQRSDYLGNVHTTNVMLNEKSRIRIFTLYSSPSEQQNLTKIKQSRHMDTYIAPQQIRFIHEDSFACINDCNRNKVDLFNIGLVLLSTIMLKDCYYIYTRTLFDINEEKLQSILEEMRKTHLNVRYSQNLLNLVQEFLVFDSLTRKTPKYYYGLLLKNETQILQLEPFNFEMKAKVTSTEAISPQVMHYLQKTSPNTKQTKYLSLAKKILQKQSSKEPIKLEQARIDVQEPNQITRKLFEE